MLFALKIGHRLQLAVYGRRPICSCIALFLAERGPVGRHSIKRKRVCSSDSIVWHS
jgi:hypothetical protein